MRRALAQVKASDRFANMFEFRLDMIANPGIGKLLSSTRKPTIATCRPRRQGGRFAGSERDRLGVLLLASSLGAKFVDIEIDVPNEPLAAFLGGRSKVILSCHMTNLPDSSLHRLYTEMHETGADVVKLAYGVNDAADIHYAIEFLTYAAKDNRNAIAVAIGDAGDASRILYKRFGGWATYAASEDGGQAAAGQLRGSTLRRLYRADRLTRSTRIFGVIGNPLAQSKGVHVHNPLFQRQRQDSVYCKFPVRNLSRFMHRVAPHLAGFSVTIPHKEHILDYVDLVDKAGESIGAVNTVVRRNGRLFGTNTDALGALDAIEKKTRVRGKVMLILGAGGAARAIAYEARQRGARVIVANRTQGRAQVLADDLHVQSVDVRDIPGTYFDVLVNATPVGMTPANGTPISAKLLRNKIVFDAVYNPPLTKLLRDARASGATTISGTDMYVNQALLQSFLYTGTMHRSSLVKRLLQAAGG